MSSTSMLVFKDSLMVAARLVESIRRSDKVLVITLVSTSPRQHFEVAPGDSHCAPAYAVTKTTHTPPTMFEVTYPTEEEAIEVFKHYADTCFLYGE